MSFSLKLKLLALLWPERSATHDWLLATHSNVDAVGIRIEPAHPHGKLKLPPIGHHDVRATTPHHAPVGVRGITSEARKPLVHDLIPRPAQVQATVKVMSVGAHRC